ncbi:PREDICTED: methyl-CpG-binding domain-containing protein 8 isoform X2 [Tarenaya hassleriana]|uniref:methyl-CpG-binding domain-containing protein 8 isoform X2 n=1 Tax=Tarenaya hassleriana TaxID=28532 RepID=UPI00053C6D45|nr:PREDICTED: methyl-CpG-binding domain-containing protein 8 isoform X2 [Tarenaya hassleriana]
MSPPEAGSRRSSASAWHATLRLRDRRRHDASSMNLLSKRTRRLFPYSDLFSLSVRLRERRRKMVEKRKVMKSMSTKTAKSVLVQMISGNETRRKRGRPRKIRSPSDRAIVIGRGEGVEASDVSNWIEALPYSNSIAMETRETSFEETPIEDLGLQRRDGASIFFTDPNSNTLSTLQVKKKRGRPPKNRDSVNQVGVSRNCEDKEPLDLQNRDGAMVDLLTLANAEDPYGEELRRRTMGLQTKAELLGFLAQLRGEWVNAGKKKRVVEASDFGDTLPRGWKLMLCVKQKAGDVWLACRRYMSPNGQQFATCKEVSAHLISILEAQGEKNQSRIRRHPHGMFYESSAGVRGDHGGMSEDPVETNLVGMGGNAVLDLVGRDNLKKSMMIDFFSREGEMVVNKELVELSSSEAMYGEKLRKMTQGLATTEELLQFWSS